ncbi:MAG: hypothetical protein ACK48V_00750 [Crocinitomicaceae bacterium]|jgi:hypothetical protein
MKKIIFCSLAIAGILIASCKKNNVQPNQLTTQNMSLEEKSEYFRLELAKKIAQSVDETRPFMADLNNSREKSTQDLPTFDQFLTSLKLENGTEFSDAAINLYKTIYDYHKSGISNDEIIASFDLSQMYYIANSMNEASTLNDALYIDNTRVAKALAPEDSVKKECKVCKATLHAIDVTAKWIWENRIDIIVTLSGAAGVYNKFKNTKSTTIF